MDLTALLEMVIALLEVMGPMMGEGGGLGGGGSMGSMGGLFGS